MYQNLKKSTILFIFLYFFSIFQISSRPVKHLDDASHYENILVDNQTFLKNEFLNNNKESLIIREYKTSKQILIPKTELQNWSDANISFRKLKFPKKFIDIDPNVKQRIKHGCIPLSAMLNGYKETKLNEIYLHCINREFPSRTKLKTIGHSALGKKIFALNILLPNEDTKHQTTERDKILVHCAIHGNESIAIEHCYDIIQQSLLNKELEPILKKLDLWIVPILNPDGVNAYWYRSFQEGRKNGFGVDLNRNFPFHWGGGSKQASSNNPKSVYYRGPSASSEPEVKSILKLFEKNHFLFSISIHCYANSLLVPYSIENKNNTNPDLAWEFVNELTKNINSQREDKPFLAKKNLYEVDGTDQDSFYHLFGTYAYLLESSHRVENYNFVPTILGGFRPLWANLLKVYDNAWKIKIKVQNQSGKQIKAKIKNNTFEYFENEIQYSNQDTGIYTLILPNNKPTLLQIETNQYLPVSLEVFPEKNPNIQIIEVLPNPN
ncbi:M14 family metallopeptidase [Leptospira sp. 96542]|nr:M14 family metallopeptidase [Leptospira sp. 96542]